MKLFHGTNIVVKHPEIRISGYNKDFGFGKIQTSHPSDTILYRQSTQNINIPVTLRTMSNIYFPEEQITYNDLYFVCYMIERTARSIKQRNRYVVEKMGKKGLAHELSIASTNHCLNPMEVVDNWKEEYQLQQGDVDVTKVDPRFTDKVPSETQMGKVYARLVSSISDDGDFVEGICNVYASPICDAIDNYNSSAYYEPSYVQTRAYINKQF